MAKRRRKAGARTKSGRLSRAYQGPARDNGTPDLRRHKLAAINGSDPALSTCLSDILFARGHLDEKQHRAALRFRRARAAIFGVVLGDRDPNRPETSEEHLENAMKRYDAMVMRLTIGQRLALSDLVLDVWPRWLRRQIAGVPLGGADLAERRDLVEGLDALAGPG